MITATTFLQCTAISLGLLAASAGPIGAQSKSMDTKGEGMPMMLDMDAANVPRVPPVAGYADGQKIYFIHTEVSDPEIGDVMTRMMDSPVPVLPSLAGATKDMVAKVWAFTNGVQPGGARGPLDFQPDVFDHPVGSGGYRPLRRLYLVTWSEGADARLLTSAGELDAAHAAGEITIERTDVVVNAPLLTWPGGQR